jgi:hypothetical protein
MVSYDVEELPRCARHVTSELMDEGGTRRSILKH